MSVCEWAWLGFMGLMWLMWLLIIIFMPTELQEYLTGKPPE